MITFKKLDEDLLVSKSSVIGVAIDILLPIRFQKRQLLQTLGFPVDQSLVAFPAADRYEIRKKLTEWMSDGRPFQIIISEKPVTTVCTPLFIIRRGSITFRSRNGGMNNISIDGMLAEIAILPTGSWIEFADILWRGDNMAGHLVYENANSQLLEIQVAVAPAQIGSTRALPYFMTMLNNFACDESYNFDRMLLRRAGFGLGISRERIEGLCYELSLFNEAFQRLQKVASWPTLEFAFVGRREFMALDVDWPAEWYRAG